MIWAPRYQILSWKIDRSNRRRYGVVEPCFLRVGLRVGASLGAGVGRGEGTPARAQIGKDRLVFNYAAKGQVDDSCGGRGQQHMRLA